MSSASFTVSLILLVLVLLTLPLVGWESAAPTQQLSSLTWLAGTWKGPMWGGEFVAYYTTPEGGKVLSYSELLKDGKVSFHEFEKLDVEDGVVRLTPFPRGNPAATFKLVELDTRARKVVFDNPEKDFPTRITYHRVSRDNLVITLSDPHGKNEKQQKFDLRRAR